MIKKIGENISISDQLVAFGDSAFIRNSVMPCSEKIQALSKRFPPTASDGSWQHGMVARPRADFGAIEGVVIATVFVGQWAAKKALDAAWDHVWPAVRSAISEPVPGKKYALSVHMRNSRTGKSILIAVVGGSEEEITKSEHLISTVLADAYRKADQSLVELTKVHLYVIENGQVNPEPIRLMTFQAACEYLKGMESVGTRIL